MNYSIEVNNVFKSYKLSKKQRRQRNTADSRLIAVHDISFGVKPGEALGLIGPNGAGKTTTLRLLSTLIIPDRGSILINGENTKNSIDSIKRMTAFLTSELKLENYFTPNYVYDFYSSLYNIKADVAQNRKEKLFERFGIVNYSDVQISKLSTGVKQRVSIAVSLVNDPDIIIYDEPTNGLDIITAKSVVDFLIEQKKQGKTVILSTHIFDIIYKLCDRVCFMMDGRIVELLNVCELVNKEKIEDVFFNLYQSRGAFHE